MTLVNTSVDMDLDIARDQDQKIKILTTRLQALDRDLADVDRERTLLEESRMLAELHINKLKVYDRINAAKPDPETQAKLSDLKNQLRMLQKKEAQLKEVHNTTNNQYESKLRRLEELRAELEDTKAKTNWDKVSQGPAQRRDFKGQENKLNELKKALAAMEDEQQITRQITMKKTELIEQLSRKLEGLQSIEDQLNEQKVVLQNKEIERQDLTEDIRTLRRIYQKKEHLMRDLQSDCERRDPQRIKRLESDKKVLQFEIQKHAEARRNNDKTIQAQHHRLQQLNNKLSAIAIALRNLNDGDGESNVEKVDVTLFEQVQRELEEARRALELKDMLMMEKDASLEVLEQKVEILTRAKRVARRRQKLENRDMLRERMALEMEIQANEEHHAARTRQLEDQQKEYERMAGRTHA